MKVLSFQIKNFRNIQDINCELSTDITILAGKNESGKTSVLDALHLFNNEQKFENTDRAFDVSSEEHTTIELKLELSIEDVKELCDELCINYSITGPQKLSMILDFTKDTFHVSGDIIDIIINNQNDEIDSLNQQIHDLIQSINNGDTDIRMRHPLNFLDQGRLDDSVQELERHLESEGISVFNDLISEFKDRLDEGYIDKVHKTIWEKRPKFIMFSDFEDLLPETVPLTDFTDLSQLETHYKVVHDFITLTKFDVKKLNTENIQERTNFTAEISNISTKRFSEFWSQGNTEFELRIDGNNVAIFIKDVDKRSVFLPKQRSKGYQWYLSFFLRLESMNQENTVILIDEPGLYLHAQAQKDVLRVLEKRSKYNQIIFSTHSPYLIDADRLDRIRLIVREKENGPTSMPKTFYEGRYSDTLTPIMTAIGLDISKTLMFSKKLTIITEGISDYYYLQGMIQFLTKQKDLDFPKDFAIIPCLGHTTIPTMVSLLLGWNYKFKILLDHKDTEATIKKLQNAGIDSEIVVIEKSGASIEELFTERDRKQFKINAQNAPKGIISKQFYEKIKSSDPIDFEPQTIDNFKKILDNLKK